MDGLHDIAFDDPSDLQRTLQSATATVKERIIFVQHMNPDISEDTVSSTFRRFGKLTKCDRLLPAKDMWIVQYANAQVR
jgi:hypothetical protein